MPSRAERRRAKQKKEKAQIWGAFAGLAVALVPSLLPRLPAVIVIVLSVLCIASWPMARDGYKYHLAMKWAILVMLIHGSLIATMGYWVWPKITVSPGHVSFHGYPNETFNFSVRNGRSDDVYDVQIPFLIGYSKHFQDKFSVKVMPNGEPPQRIYIEYNYCFGRKADGVISHVQPNEREVLIVHLTHLPAYGYGNFSITYDGGQKLDTQSESPTFASEPTSYSASQGTVGVRGDYRICKYEMGTNGGSTP